MTRQTKASVKSKELQTTAQSQGFAAHLLLPQHTTIIHQTKTLA